MNPYKFLNLQLNTPAPLTVNKSKPFVAVLYKERP